MSKKSTNSNEKESFQFKDLLNSLQSQNQKYKRALQYKQDYLEQCCRENSEELLNENAYSALYSNQRRSQYSQFDLSKDSIEQNRQPTSQNESATQASGFVSRINNAKFDLEVINEQIHKQREFKQQLQKKDLELKHTIVELRSRISQQKYQNKLHDIYNQGSEEVTGNWRVTRW